MWLLPLELGACQCWEDTMGSLFFSCRIWHKKALRTFSPAPETFLVVSAGVLNVERKD